MAALRFAGLRLAVFRFAGLRLAVFRLAVLRLAVLRLAVLRFTVRLLAVVFLFAGFLLRFTALRFGAALRLTAALARVRLGLRERVVVLFLALAMVNLFWFTRMYIHALCQILSLSTFENTYVAHGTH